MSKKNSEYLINRKDNQYEVVIGLEVHAQVLSESKLFSSSSTKFGAEPNTQVSLVDVLYLIEKIIFMQIYLKDIRFLNLKILL